MQEGDLTVQTKGPAYPFDSDGEGVMGGWGRTSRATSRATPSEIGFTLLYLPYLTGSSPVPTAQICRQWPYWRWSREPYLTLSAVRLPKSVTTCKVDDAVGPTGIAAMMIGCAVFGYIIGSVTSIVANQDAASAQLAERVANLNAYMKDRRLV